MSIWDWIGDASSERLESTLGFLFYCVVSIEEREGEWERKCIDIKQGIDSYPRRRSSIIDGRDRNKATG
jgi:hypothetical protein